MGIPIADETPYTGVKPVVNMTLVITNIVVFALGVIAPWVLVPGARSYDDVIYTLGMIPAKIVDGESLYTILTAMFLHGSLAHLMGNMLYLYIFGDNIEAVMGNLRYLMFYIASGIGAVVFHLASIAFMPREALVNSILAQGVNPWLIPAVGASGAISGVLGAYALLFPSSRVRVVTFWAWIPVFLEFPALVYITIWFVYQLIMGLSVSLAGVHAGVAFWAHIGGFLTGMALVPLFADKTKLRHAIAVYASRL